MQLLQPAKAELAQTSNWVQKLEQPKHMPSNIPEHGHLIECNFLPVVLGEHSADSADKMRLKGENSPLCEPLLLNKSGKTETQNTDLN